MALRLSGFAGFAVLGTCVLVFGLAVPSAGASELAAGGAWAKLNAGIGIQEETEKKEDLVLDVPVSFVSDPTLLSPTDLTIGYSLPAFGTFSVTAPDTFGAASLTPRAPSGDVQGQYATKLFGGQVGVFGEVTDQPSAFAMEPSTSRTVGASVGYGGFYLRGAVQSADSDGLIDSRRAWQAGFGYGTDAFDVRLTYAESDFTQTGLIELDGKQWMLGGLVQLTPSILLDANAFYVDRQKLVPTVEPPGTGARVGVRLRF